MFSVQLTFFFCILSDVVIVSGSDINEGLINSLETLDTECYGLQKKL